MTDTFDPSQYKILCVDDEPNILSSLRRMLSLEGFQVSTADSGAQALALMDTESFDVLVSDMQMPVMNGAQLLEAVRQKSPATMRLLLTGAADVGSAIAAINQGEIYRYLTKPWDDAEMIATIRSAIELAQAAKAREARLRASYVSSIKAFSGLMALRLPDLLTHSRRVANLSRKIARLMGMSEEQAQEVYIAGLLHDVGKVGLSDRILSTKFIELPLGDAKIYRKHCEMGQQSLKMLEELNGVGQIVRSHHEYFNGTGYPDRLEGDNIVAGARILAIVEAFEELVSGDYAKEPTTPKEALRIVASNRGKLFCPVVCDHFVRLMTPLLN